MEFRDWVKHIFDHAAPEMATYSEIMEPIEWDGSPELKIVYMARLFEEPRPLLDAFSDLQVAHGLEYLTSNLMSDYPLGFRDASVSLESRSRCMRAIYTVYEQVFAKRCTPGLVCARRRVSPLNGMCYMWWDTWAFSPKCVPPEARILDETALTVMEVTLELDSLPCQEGALHGLGHWHSSYPREVSTIIDAYLERNTAIPAVLRAYAEDARRGHVL
ncbi:MAG: hypothetical protein IT365_10885 [Candidatus Hydrogenedentes bacterium]|nr:hypothetical protein [Candidatus Hydrogenedentota bacterium]